MRKKKTIKCVKRTTPPGRDIIEVSPDNNINADKVAMTYNDFQKKRLAKSDRYKRQLTRPYRAPRMGMQATRRKKL